MAFVTFSPQGVQLDNDEIADLQAQVGEGLGFNFTVDTSGLDANLQSLKLRLEGDSTEVNLSDTLTDFFETTFPDVAVVEDNSEGEFISVVVELRGEPGAIPNTTNVLVESEATVEDGLVNDGATDIGVTVLEAIDANGNDVTELFAPNQQTVDLQPSTPVQEIIGTDQCEPIIGTPQNDLIIANEGNDLIIDSEGDDRSFGEEGNDLFLDDAGSDTLIGGVGNDFVNVDSDSGGDDTIDLGEGNNYAFGGTGADTFVLNRDSGVTGIGDFTPGEDRFALGENLTQDDLSFAQLNSDNLGSFNGTTVISDAETGKLIAVVNFASTEAVSNAEFVDAESVLPIDDSPTAGENSPEPIFVELTPPQSGDIFGTPDPDVLVGDDGDNLILPGGGNNFVNATGGDDRVFGEENLNVFNGGAGNDVLDGGVDEDILNGGGGDDTLVGGTASNIFNVLNGDGGNDVLVGGSDSDGINGGQGDDLIFGGAGNDGLFGNEGGDTFVFALGEEADVIFDFEPEQDAIAFTTDVDYSSLNIEYNAEGNYTNISDETGQLITTLVGVEADQLSESNFTTVREQSDNSDTQVEISETAILGVPDFDGNGVVDAADVEDITARTNSSEGEELYHPLYDLDTNGTIDDHDVALVNSAIGQDVPLVDRQIAQGTQATMKYYGAGGLERAIQDGYIPSTSEAMGYGAFYTNYGLLAESGDRPEDVEQVDIERPVGLNFDAAGSLVAVFYLGVPSNPENSLELSADLVGEPPASFDTISAEDWRTRQSGWFTGLGSLNSEELYLEEDVPLEAVVSRLEATDFQLFPESDVDYSPLFWTLQGWFHSINPNGTFADTNPNVSPYAFEVLSTENDGELIAGTDAEDGLFGTDRGDSINVFNGDDWAIGGLGDDSIWGGQGNDWLAGDEENSEAGNDMLFGGPGSDAIYGRAGSDRLFGGQGDDFIVGGAEEDLLRGGLGYDNLTGNEGADEFVLVAGEGTDTIHDLEIDLDTIVLYGGLRLEDVAIAQDGNNTILSTNGETLAVLNEVDAEALTAVSEEVFLTV